MNFLKLKQFNPTSLNSNNDSFMNSFLDDFFTSPRFFDREKDFFPLMTAQEDKDSYRLSIEVPGIKREDISIKVQEGSLIVSGEKRTTQESNDKGTIYNETRYGSFRREIPLASDCDVEKVSANLDHGVLTLDIGKKDIHTSGVKNIDIR